MTVYLLLKCHVCVCVWGGGGACSLETRFEIGHQQLSKREMLGMVQCCNCFSNTMHGTMKSAL